MAQSLHHIYLHLIFGVRLADRCLSREIRPRLYAYLAEVSNTMGYSTILFGGFLDHVHGLTCMGKDTLPKDWVRTLKANSSRFLKDACGLPGGFSWQGGYALFSVGPSRVDACRAYIENQEQHHKTRTWHEEVEGFLERYRLDVNPSHLWG